ncbi:hypothetical protein K3495_g4010 [Podosphaera aphanis]|nr:hypothetical protein K3495_g4010 [Podosphaera aphanis]
MNGTNPVTSYLKVWVCLCYVMIETDDPQRYKLSQTSLKGILVGYCESLTQYRVFISSKGGRDKTFFSANVRFFEDKFWDWTKTSQEQFLDSNTSILDDEACGPDTDESSDNDEDSNIQMDPNPLPVTSTSSIISSRT